MSSAFKKLAVLVLAFSPVLAQAQESAIIFMLSGTVETAAKDGDWQAAQKGQTITDGVKIRTGANGRAALLFKNRATVWVKENTRVTFSSKAFKHQEVSLEGGSIKTRVPHLRWKEKFNIRTPTTLAAVRGTELISTVAENDPAADTAEAKKPADEQTAVLFGHVKLMDEKTNKSASLTQGTIYGSGTTQLLTREMELSGLEDWTPGIPENTRRMTLAQNEQKRQEIRQFASATLAVSNEILAGQTAQKEEDFAAARTLVDVHGNVVRVQQRLERPDNRSIQVLNVVKRTTYASGGLRKWTYNGVNSPRVDALVAKVQFNKDLPAQINELPGFFEANDNTLKVEAAQMVAANMGDRGNVFVIGFFGKRKPQTGKDDIQSDLYVGTLQSGSGQTGVQKLFNLTLDSADNVAGLVHFKEDTTSALRTIDSGDSKTGELYHFDAKLWQEVGAPSTKLWTATESFVINNSGKVRNVSDFTNGSENFLSLLKENAGQVIIFAKSDLGGNQGPSQTDFNLSNVNPGKKNVDLVITPDLILSVIKTLATSGDVFKTTY